MNAVGYIFIYTFLISETTDLGVVASLGDRTYIYQNCVEDCVQKNCQTSQDLKKFYKQQPLSEWMLSWSCENECSYECMWKTVDAFIYHGEQVPQFHGKWPFVRIFGIQEPASALFSVLNGLGHLAGLMTYVSKVKASNPFYRVSVGFGILAINVWMCSTIFHTRDFLLTERLDYFSATAGVLYSLYLCIYRMSMGLDNTPSKDRGKSTRTAAFTTLLLFFICHISYLSFVKFDYGYNMMINLIAGLGNGAAWLFYHWKTRNIFKHQWKGSVAVCYTTVLVTLELMDFPPIWWTFDAHSVWHAGTILFPILCKVAKKLFANSAEFQGATSNEEWEQKNYQDESE